MNMSMSKFISIFNFIKAVIGVGISLICIAWSCASFFDNSISHPLRDLYMYIAQTFYYSLSDGATLPNQFGSFSKIGFIGAVYLVIGACVVSFCTLKIWSIVGSKLFDKLEKKCLVAKFGKRKYDVYCKIYNQKVEVAANKSAEVNELEKAQIAHYEKWKVHYRSSLSYSEWKEKVLHNGEK